MIPLFDAYCGFGGREPGQRRPVTAEALREEMSRLSIERALVRTAPEELAKDLAAGNEALLAACRDHSGLVGCPVVVPGGEDAADEAQQVGDLLDHGAGAVCVLPKSHYWLPAEWLAGRLFAALAERKAPVLCQERELPLAEVADLAGRHPQLPVLLAGCGYRWQRVVLALLEAFANVHLCLGGAWSLQGGVEQVVRRVGAERVLFGSGFPGTTAAAAVTMLTYADLADEQKRLIGAGNLDRLLGGVLR